MNQVGGHIREEIQNDDILRFAADTARWNFGAGLEECSRPVKKGSTGRRIW
jgi:hypothetical protein